ncbi:MAG: restriction endonuclease subunit S [Desulfobulbaceae bacterium]|nr:restriction endonuclease subunit S [Desulfobulbaceae bacterium]
MSATLVPEGWVKETFCKAVTRLKNNTGKLKASKYLQDGQLPVVDQGQSLIVGYSNDKSSSFKGPYPVIVFGDHTRNVKFIDFEFVVGADGVVLLRPTDETKLDSSFLFYWLKYVPLHNLGYSRHYKLLKEKSIIFPEDVTVQRRIVELIGKLTIRADDALRVSAEREIELDTLLQSLYSRMIEESDWKPLGKVASLVRRAISTKSNESYEEMGVRSFGKGTFVKPVLTGKQLGNKRIYRIHEGDLVFNNVFAWERAIAVAKAEDHGRVGSHRFITYVPHEKKATSEFLCHHFLSKHGIEDIRAASPGSAGRNRTLGLKKLEKIKVPVPDYDEQKRFAEIARRRQLIQYKTTEIAEEVKAFSAALIAKAFRGEL